MKATSAPFATMVEGGIEYTLVWQIQMALPGGIYPDVSISASGVEVDQSITTDQPAGTRLEEGYASVQATFTLAGPLTATDETKTAAWLFSRYSTTSPLYHSDAFMSEVTVSIGLLTEGSRGVPEMIQKFVGYVADYTQDPDGGVAFTCYDPATILRSTTDIAAVITTPPYNAGLTSEFAIDNLLRNATGGKISSWPAQRPSCVLAVGMRSSLWPEVGTLTGSFTTPAFVPGVNGSGLGPGQLPGYNLASAVGSSLFVEYRASNLLNGQVDLDINDPGTGDAVHLTVINSGSTHTVAVIATQAGSPQTMGTVTIASTDTYLGVAVTWAPGSHSFTALVETNSVMTTVGGTTTVARAASTLTHAYVATLGAGGFAEWQISTETFPVSNAAFVPQAILDPSLNPLQLIPEIDAVADPWATIQTIAQAEMAVARFDESTGQFLYQNRHTVGSQMPARTITATQSLASVGGIVSSAASVLNRAQVGYTGWTFATTETVAWSAQKVRSVAKGTPLVIQVALDNFYVNPDSSFSIGAPTAVASVFRASTSADGLNPHPDPSQLHFVLTQPSPNLMRLVITNTSGTPAFFVSPATFTDVPPGTIVLQFAATLVTANTEVVADYQWPPISAGGAASSRFGEVAYQLTGNPWIQDAATALTLAQVVVNSSYLPTPSFTGMEILLDPRLQVGDVVEIDDTERTGAVDFVRIFGSNISIQEGEPGDAPTYTHTIDGVALGTPGSWLAGIPSRSEAGVTTYAA